MYAYMDKNIKAANLRELLSGFKYTPMNLSDWKPILPSDAEAAVVHGVLRGSETIIKEAETHNVPWLYMDNAGTYFDDMYKRVIWNATAPITHRPGRRFEHNTKMEQWKGGQGEYILVLPPSPPYMDTFDCRNFLNYCAHTINQYTGRPIVVRGKPAKGRHAPPLEEQIRNAYAVVCWGSAVALDAMCMGIPTISMGWCPAKMASFELSDLETSKLEFEKDRMGVYDNLTWSCFKREELSGAFAIAGENATYPKFDTTRPKNNVINTL